MARVIEQSDVSVPQISQEFLDLILHGLLREVFAQPDREPETFQRSFHVLRIVDRVHKLMGGVVGVSDYQRDSARFGDPFNREVALGLSQTGKAQAQESENRHHGPRTEHYAYHTPIQVIFAGCFTRLSPQDPARDRARR